MTRFKLLFAGITIVVLTVIALCLFEFKTVKGGEMGVKETWTSGVVNEVLQPKNYYLFPGFSQEIYTYDMTLRTFELVDYVIRSSDNQEMTIRSKVQWRRDPSKLVHHHTFYKQNAETAAISPAMMSAILKHGTEYKALEAYSGDGLIKMQNDIQKDLMTNQQLKDGGIIVETYIIEYNHLRPEYLETINVRQLATLRQSAAVEKEKAANAEALVAKAEAQANLNKAVVEAERDKEVQVLKAEANQQQEILAAKAQAQKLELEAQGQKAKMIAEAEGKKQAMIAEAEGTLAMGKAEAAAKKAMLEAYAAQGADSWVKVEISKNMATAFSGIKGYIPEKMGINVLSDSFTKSLDLGTGNPVVLPAK